MRKEKMTQMFWIIWKLLWILFALLIAYQILVKVFGGSWISDTLTIGFLVLNTTLIINVAINQAKMRADLNNLARQFQSLAHDFKEHIKEQRH